MLTHHSYAFLALTCQFGCRIMSYVSWLHHQMEAFFASLALAAENSPVTGEFPTKGPVTRSFDILFVLRLNKWLSKESWGWWFETPSRSLWRFNLFVHCCMTYGIKLTLDGGGSGQHLRDRWGSGRYLRDRWLLYSPLWGRPGGRLNIKVPSYQYRDSHVKESLTWESPYLGKTVFILRRGPGAYKWCRP